MIPTVVSCCYTSTYDPPGGPFLHKKSQIPILENPGFATSYRVRLVVVGFLESASDLSLKIGFLGNVAGGALFGRK